MVDGLFCFQNGFSNQVVSNRLERERERAAFEVGKYQVIVQLI